MGCRWSCPACPCAIGGGGRLRHLSHACRGVSWPGLLGGNLPSPVPPSLQLKMWRIKFFYFFSAIFNGPHVAVAVPAEPMDSLCFFYPNLAHFPWWSLLPLPGRMRISGSPLHHAKLTAAVVEGVPNKSPGLDGLTYEYYCTNLSSPLLPAL